MLKNFHRRMKLFWPQLFVARWLGIELFCILQGKFLAFIQYRKLEFSFSAYFATLKLKILCFVKLHDLQNLYNVLKAFQCRDKIPSLDLQNVADGQAGHLFFPSIGNTRPVLHDDKKDQLFIHCTSYSLAGMFAMCLITMFGCYVVIFFVS